MDPTDGPVTDTTAEPGRRVHVPDEAPPALTVVIPAYNEAERLPATLDDILAFLNSRDYSWEIIVADDGSEDATPTIAAALAAQRSDVRHLRLPHRGKAAAVREGVLAARGNVVVFTDADLSTPIDYVDRVRELIAAGWDVVIGTREGAGARRLGEPVYRHLMGRVYNYAVRLLAVRGISDTQCGFKGFSRGVARDLFLSTRLYRDVPAPVRGPLVTGFDVELLFLARKRHYRVCELPVTWRHVPGSKVRPGLDALLMLRDALRVRVNDLRGCYPTDAQGAARREACDER